MISFLKKNSLLILILLLAAFLRLYKLGSYPAINADEAAIGYNAYSLIQTGMDEHGHPWPVHFQSFNDYKPGLYFYLALPFVKAMGLNEWAVRLPNAFLAIATVLILYLLVKEFFGNEEIALISAFFLSISPWHLHFSRGGWEVNTATFFIALGVLSFLKALRKPSFLTFILSLLPFILSLYTYHAARVVVPLLCLGLFVLYRNELVRSLKTLLIVAAFGVILLVPLGRDLIQGEILSRAAGVGLFADKGPINRINEQRGEHGSVNSLSGRLIHNKVINYGLALFENWTAHFNGEFLFLTGDNIERDKVPETGEMYLFDILFLAFGFLAIFRDYSRNAKSYSLILLWLAVSPVAAALTFQAPHALRAENMVIPLVIVASFGFYRITKWVVRYPAKSVRIVASVVLGVLMIWNFARYEHMYWVHMAKEYPYSSQYGVKELVAYIDRDQIKYKDVVVTTRYDQPYILFLFYLKYRPQVFQFNHTLTTRDEFGFSTVADFGKYHFGPIDFQSVKNQYPGSLIIGTPNEIPKEANIVKRIYGTNGFEYFDIVVN